MDVKFSQFPVGTVEVGAQYVGLDANGLNARFAVDPILGTTYTIADGLPGALQGKDGDIYMNALTGISYQITSGVWSEVATVATTAAFEAHAGDTDIHIVDVDIDGISYVRKDKGWVIAPTGGGGVDSVGVAAPITDTGTATDPIIGIPAAAGPSTDGYMTGADKAKLDGVEDGAEVNNISDVDATALTDGGETTLHSHPGGGSSPLNTKGDLYTFDDTADAKLAIGAQGQMLAVNTSTTTGLEWIPAPTGSGSVTNVSGNAPVNVVDQTTTPVITLSGDKAEFNTALEDGDFLFVGDVPYIPVVDVDFDPVGTDNSDDNAPNTLYANDYRASNFVADTDYQSVPLEGAFADGDKTKLDAITGTNTGDVTSTPTTDITTTVTGQDLTSTINDNAITRDKILNGEVITAKIGAGAVNNNKLAEMPALTLKGNNAGILDDAKDLTVAEVNAMLGNTGGGHILENDDTPLPVETVLNSDGTYVEMSAGTGQTEISLSDNAKFKLDNASFGFPDLPIIGPNGVDPEPIFLVYVGDYNGISTQVFETPKTPSLNPKVFVWQSQGGTQVGPVFSWQNVDMSLGFPNDYINGLTDSYIGYIRNNTGNAGMSLAYHLAETTGRNVYIVIHSRRGLWIGDLSPVVDNVPTPSLGSTYRTIRNTTSGRASYVFPGQDHLIPNRTKQTVPDVYMFSLGTVDAQAQAPLVVRAAYTYTANAGAVTVPLAGQMISGQNNKDTLNVHHTDANGNDRSFLLTGLVANDTIVDPNGLSWKIVTNAPMGTYQQFTCVAQTNIGASTTVKKYCTITANPVPAGYTGKSRSNEQFAYDFINAKNSLQNESIPSAEQFYTQWMLLDIPFWWNQSLGNIFDGLKFTDTYTDERLRVISSQGLEVVEPTVENGLPLPPTSFPAQAVYSADALWEFGINTSKAVVIGPAPQATVAQPWDIRPDLIPLTGSWTTIYGTVTLGLWNANYDITPGAGIMTIHAQQVGGETKRLQDLGIGDRIVMTPPTGIPYNLDIEEKPAYINATSLYNFKGTLTGTRPANGTTCTLTSNIRVLSGLPSNIYSNNYGGKVDLSNNLLTNVYALNVVGPPEDVVSVTPPPMFSFSTSKIWDVANIQMPPMTYFTGEQWLRKSMFNLGGGFLFWSAPTFRVDPGAAGPIGLGPFYTIVAQPIFRADNQNMSGILSVNAFMSPTFTADAGRTLNITAYNQNYRSDINIQGDGNVTVALHTHYAALPVARAGTTAKITRSIGFSSEEQPVGSAVTSSAAFVHGTFAADTGAWGYYQSIDIPNKFTGTIRNVKLAGAANKLVVANSSGDLIQGSPVVSNFLFETAMDFLRLQVSTNAPVWVEVGRYAQTAGWTERASIRIKGKRTDAIGFYTGEYEALGWYDGGVVAESKQVTSLGGAGPDIKFRVIGVGNDVVLEIKAVVGSWDFDFTYFTELLA